MNHDEVRANIPGWATRRLDPSVRAVLETHFSECEACNAAASAALTLARELGLHGAELFTPHPDTEALRRHAFDRAGLRDPTLERHVASCASCTLEIEAWRAQGTMVRPIQQRSIRGREVTIGAVGVAAGLLLALGILVMSRPGESRVDVATSVPRVLLRNAVRGPDGESELLLAKSATVGLLDASFRLPEGTEATARVRFELRDASGRVTWSTTRPAIDVMADLTAHEVVGFLVPVRTLPDGKYRFDVSIDGSASPTLLAASFRIRRGDQD